MLNILSTYITLATSIFLVAFYLYKNGLEFLVGFFVALPFSWFIIFLIFRAEKDNYGIDKLSLGEQLSFFSTQVFTGIRFSAVILLVVGQLLFKNILSFQTFADISTPDNVQMLSLLYVVLCSLVTELLFVTIIFDIIKIFGKKDVYSSGYNPKWKSIIAYGAVLFPFIFIGIITIISILLI